MSGGHFNYAQLRIIDIINELETAIEHNKEYSNKTISEFQTGLHHLKLAYIYAQRIDWLLSGDDGEDTFHFRLNEELDKYYEM